MKLNNTVYTWYSLFLCVLCEVAAAAADACTYHILPEVT